MKTSPPRRPARKNPVRVSHTYGETYRDFRAGDRVELAPHLDRWMMGDRYGTVTRATKAGVSVAMDRSGRTLRFAPQNLRAEHRPNPSVACATSRKKDRYRTAKVKHKGEWLALNGCWDAKGVPSYAGYGETGRLRVIAKRTVSSKASRSPRLVKGVRARKRS